MALLHFTVFVALIATSLACSCIQPPPFEQAVNDARDGDTPYFVAKVLTETRTGGINGQVTYKLEVTTGCSTTRIQQLTTCGNSACCGVNLEEGTSYALPLNRNGLKSTLNLCQVFSPVSSLTAEQLELVSVCPTGSKKPLRCKPQCVCVRAPCPCAEEPRCPSGLECVNDLCEETDASCAAVLCPVGTICKNGKCLDPPTTDASCAAVLCQTGTTCKKGKCVENPKLCRPRCKCYGCPCYFRPRCPRGYVCKGRYCVRKPARADQVQFVLEISAFRADAVYLAVPLTAYRVLEVGYAERSAVFVHGALVGRLEVNAIAVFKNLISCGFSFQTRPILSNT